MMTSSPQRGFTLLIAIILATVSLAVGLALADVAYKQVVLSSTARNSQIAFYRADSALECALYYDQQFAAFSTGSTYSGTFVCAGQNVTVTRSGLSDGGTKTQFSVACAGGGQSAAVTIYKQQSATCNVVGTINAKSCFFASGFNTCSQSDPNRFERALKAIY